MSRIKVILGSRGRTLAALSLALAAVGVAVGSGANFSASSASAANTFSAGTLSMSNDKANQAILTAGGLRPGGDASTGAVKIKNTGSLSGAFTVERGSITETDGNPTNAANAKLATKLNLAIVDCGQVTQQVPDPSCNGASNVYSGTLDGFNTSGSPRSLGNFAAGEEHKYQFSVALDGSAGDSYQGDQSEVAFSWKASS